VAAAYPVLLDITRWTAVIIGGGPVAARKARGLLEAGAACVRCIAPAFCDAIPPQVERVWQAYRPEHLDGARLVFAATDDPQVNDAIVRDAGARHLPVNRADGDEDQPGDFTIPARLRRGEVILAISAGSPALATLIRDKLDSSFDPRWEQMAHAMQELRPLIKSANVEIASRQRIFRELAGEEALSVIAARGADGLRGWLLERHPELHHG
jgi:precorrin-2 dehydrogenase/sirohydrochlorin ferrochelatase